MTILSEKKQKEILLRQPGVSHADIDVSLDEIESFGDNSSLNSMVKDIASYKKMLREKITFVNSSLTNIIPFTRENLYLICAYSGNGKSTIAANISYPLWQQGKKILVISNEESKQDVLLRIACLHFGLNFNSYKKGIMPGEDLNRAVKLFPDIAKYVKVIDVNYKDGLTTRIEGVKNILDKVRHEDYSCALIDYFQLIKFSVEDTNASTYQVLNNLRIWLGQYIKNSNIPLAVFAQLHSIGKRNNKDLDSRIKHCPDIYEPSTVVIEAVPNFDLETTEFMLHKDRFGLAGKKVTCGYVKGKYVDLDESFLSQIEQRKMDSLAGKLDQEQETED